MLSPSETERTTAATDALLGLLCVGLAISLALMPVQAAWKRNVWVAAFACLAGSSILGAIAHGLTMSAAAREALWKPLYLLLALSVALVAVGAIHDWQGEGAARGLMPWALIAAAGFFVASQMFGGAFALFLAYEGVATLGALLIYGSLAVRGTMAGATALSVGLGLTLVAAAIQMSGLSLRLLVRFDHNGLFHLVQIVALLIIAAGVRASLRPA